MLFLSWLDYFFGAFLVYACKYLHFNHTLQIPTFGAVVSESTLCSNIGADLLHQGGNAADAMVGTVFCIGVVAMYHSGIGGGGVALVRSARGTFEAVDFRETAPAAAHEHMFRGNVNESMWGGLASGVPGELRGLEYLHSKYGRLPWRDVLRPAVRLARNGFKLTQDLARYMEAGQERLGPFLIEDPAWAEDFARNGSLLRVGDIMTRKRYADTLEDIANLGPHVFYRGPMAETTVQALRQRNGSMTLEDLSSYRVVSRQPVEISYRDFRVVGFGAPASGGVVLSALKTVEGYDNMGEAVSLNMSTHRLDEAARFAYGERSSLGDPDYVPSVRALQSKMLDETYAAGKRAKISDQHTLNVSDYNPDGFEILANHGTAHLSAADSSGLAISLTSTINFVWGGLIMVNETGIVMNNQMNDFSIPRRRDGFRYRPSPSNYIRPGKRPQSSMTPIIVEHASNHSLFHITGAAGGARIITATLQDLWHTLDHGISAQDAVREPRFHDMLLPDTCGFEVSILAPV